jgi:hypothetical protein
MLISFQLQEWELRDIPKRRQSNIGCPLMLYPNMLAIIEFNPKIHL